MPNLSFAGCGFLGIYHMGVGKALQMYAPHLLTGHISGASAGSWVAAALVCEVPIEDFTKKMLKVANAVRKKMMGPFNPGFPVETMLREVLYETFPLDAHLRVNGRIQISLTRAYDLKNIIMSHFETFDDVITACICSSFIPGFIGWIPYTLGNVHYIDGGFSNNLPILNEKTITISPFAGEGDISPKKSNINSFKLHVLGMEISVSMTILERLSRIMLPPTAKEFMTICQDGFADAVQYLIKNKIHAPGSAQLSYEDCDTELPEVMRSVFEKFIREEEMDEITNESEIREKAILHLKLANFTCYKLLNTLRDNQDSNSDRNSIEDDSS